MKCEEFKSWLEGDGPSGPPVFPDRMLEEYAEHYRSCPDCQSVLHEEVVWTKFFAAAPEASLSRSLWPGVMAKIQEQTKRSESFSAAIILLGRRLAPAFALFLLLVGGAAYWQGSGPGFRGAEDPRGVLVEDAPNGLGPLNGEPESILNRWVGANDP